uniref:Uncharacterized protein n=1 Tax=Arundo donax TaxID=35708 RepID=A0A0A8YHN8_ARUDO
MTTGCVMFFSWPASSNINMSL